VSREQGPLWKLDRFSEHHAVVHPFKRDDRLQKPLSDGWGAEEAVYSILALTRVRKLIAASTIVMITWVSTRKSKTFPNAFPNDSATAIQPRHPAKLTHARAQSFGRSTRSRFSPANSRPARVPDSAHTSVTGMFLYPATEPMACSRLPTMSSHPNIRSTIFTASNVTMLRASAVGDSNPERLDYQPSERPAYSPMITALATLPASSLDSKKKATQTSFRWPDSNGLHKALTTLSDPSDCDISRRLRNLATPRVQAESLHAAPQRAGIQSQQFGGSLRSVNDAVRLL